MIELSVLVVDDEEGMRAGASRCLESHRFTIPETGDEVSFSMTTAADGKSALSILEKNGTDLVLLDHKLPDISGLDILDRLKSMKRVPLVIMITAYASIDVAVNATKQGAFDFLAKPFTPEELRLTVQKAATRIGLEKNSRRLEEEKRQIRFQFISVLSHELKSPLAAIENYLMIMRDRILGDELDKYGTMVGRSLIRIEGMRRMIYDLLDLTRIESGQMQRTIAPLDMESLAGEAAEGTAHLAGERGITVNVDISKDLSFNGDRQEMAIVINNLISNAVKYNRDGGTVFLKMQKKDDTLLLTCRDTGIGMASEEVSRLFSEFARIKNDKTKDIPGSGLGLSIVKKIVDLYDGTIDVESVPDEGTTFILSLKEKDITSDDGKVKPD